MKIHPMLNIQFSRAKVNVCTALRGIPIVQNSSRRSYGRRHRRDYRRVIVLGTRAITDIPTAIIALVSLAVLWRYKIGEPIIVTVAGLIGLILWPLMHAG